MSDPKTLRGRERGAKDRASGGAVPSVQPHYVLMLHEALYRQRIPSTKFAKRPLKM